MTCDGAMGTMLYARGVPLDAWFDALDQHNPGLVRAGGEVPERRAAEGPLLGYLQAHQRGLQCRESRAGTALTKPRTRALHFHRHQ